MWTDDVHLLGTACGVHQDAIFTRTKPGVSPLRSFYLQIYKIPVFLGFYQPRLLQTVSDALVLVETVLVGLQTLVAVPHGDLTAGSP